MKLLLCTVMMLIAAALVPSDAAAQTYPSRPIRLIVPFTPGGTTDILARAVGQKMSEALGVQVIIDNRPGAAGSIGAEIAAKAKPDGYTLLMGHIGTLAVNPALYAISAKSDERGEFDKDHCSNYTRRAYRV